MKKIVITQRRDEVVGKDEQRDATDVKIGKILFIVFNVFFKLL